MSATAWNILEDARVELLKLESDVVSHEGTNRFGKRVAGASVSDMSDQAEALKRRLTQFQKAIDPAT